MNRILIGLLTRWANKKGLTVLFLASPRQQQWWRDQGVKLATDEKGIPDEVA